MLTTTTAPSTPVRPSSRADSPVPGGYSSPRLGPASRPGTPKLEIDSIPVLPPPSRHSRNRSLPVLAFQPAAVAASAAQPRGPRAFPDPAEPTTGNNNMKTDTNSDHHSPDGESRVFGGASDKTVPARTFLFSILTLHRLQLTNRVTMGRLTLPAVVVPYIFPTSPSSFFTGILCGMFIAWLRPSIEYYLDIWAQYVAHFARFLIIWASIAVVCWGIIRVIQSTSAATMNIPAHEELKSDAASTTTAAASFAESPQIDSDAFSTYSYRPLSPVSDNASIYSSGSYASNSSGYSDKSYTTYSSKATSSSSYKASTPKSSARSSYTTATAATKKPTASSRDSSPSKSKKKDEVHAYRPYPARPSLAAMQSDELSVLSRGSDEHVSVLEKPVGQSAFRIQRKV